LDAVCTRGGFKKRLVKCGHRQETKKKGRKRDRSPTATVQPQDGEHLQARRNIRGRMRTGAKKIRGERGKRPCPNARVVKEGGGKKSPSYRGRRQGRKSNQGEDEIAISVQQGVFAITNRQCQVGEKIRGSGRVNRVSGKKGQPQ